MSRVDISSAGFSKVLLPNGMLQTDSALNTTLQTVKDNVGNSSTLLLSTVDAQFNSTLRIHTDSSELLDIEDTGANNRFNINRVVQKINLDFSSKPTDTTTVVGAIRTATNGSNLADVFTFLENGTVGLNNPSPSSTYKLDIVGNVNASSYIVTGGTSSQFLKANGSLDSTAYTPQTRTLTINGTAQDLSADRSWTIPTYSPPNGLLRTANAIYSTLQTVTDYLNNTTSLQLNSGRVGLLSDSTVATQTSAVIQATTTNANLVLSPNGTGAIVASIPDGTATGGNARGANAVDLQTSRSAATQIASGTQSFTAGLNNTASGVQSVSLGYNCTSSSTATIALGYQSQATNAYALSFGYQAIASTAHSFAAVYGANASGNSAIALGNATVASGTYSFSTNSGNTSSGINSFSCNNANNAVSNQSSAFGYQSYTSLTNQQSLGNGISYKGDAQTSKVVYSISTGSVSTGGTYTFTGAELIVPKNASYSAGVTQAYLCTATFIYGARNKIGTVTTINSKDCFTAIYNFAAKSTLNSGALIGTPTLLTSFSDTNLSGTTISITIGASGNILFSFTPPAWIGGGTIEFRGTLYLQFTELGLYN